MDCELNMQASKLNTRFAQKHEQLKTLITVGQDCNPKLDWTPLLKFLGGKINSPSRLTFYLEKYYYHYHDSTNTINTLHHNHTQREPEIKPSPRKLP